MKTLPFLLFHCFLGFAVFSYAQQIKLSGQVSIHNSKYETGQIQLVKDAQVMAAFTSPDVTKNKGKFSLVFTGLDSGTKAQITVEKNGLEVVNSHDLANVIMGSQFPLRVSMDSTTRLAKRQAEFYQIGKQALYKEYDQKVDILQAEGVEQEILIAQLNKELNLDLYGKNEAIYELKKQRRATEKKLPEFAKELASVNLDFASGLYIEAYEWFWDGRIQKALTLLDAAELEKTARDALMAIEAGKRRARKGREQVRQVIDGYKLKAEGYHLLFEYHNAILEYKKAIELLKIIREEQDLELAKVYKSIGTVYLQLAEYNKALEFSLKNVAICEDVLNEKDTTLADAYSHLALIYFYQGEFRKAYPVQQKALRVQKEVLKTHHPDLAESYSNLTGIYKGLGDLEKALEAQQKAIRIEEKIYKPHHLGLGTSYNNEAMIYKDLGKYKKALESVNKAFAIQEDALGSNDPDLAFTYHSLGSIYTNLKKNKRSLKFQEIALDIFEQTFEPNHPYISEIYSNMTENYIALGDHDKALEVGQKALYIYEQTLEENHPHIATNYDTFGDIYLAMEEYKEAKSFYERAYAIKKEQLGSEDPNTKKGKEKLDQVIQTLHVSSQPGQLVRNSEEATPPIDITTNDKVSTKNVEQQSKGSAPSQDYGTFQITKKTSLRVGPTSSTRVLKRLKVGTSLSILEKTNRYWWKASCNGQIGYVKALLLEPLK